MSEWEIAQSWEQQWHSNCINSLYEEEKQIVYAEKMGLIRFPTPKTPYNFDLSGVSVLDIGGGAYSLLLKCTNYEKSVITDPLMDRFPDWVIKRYNYMHILPLNVKGEEIASGIEIVDKDLSFDEVWIYNVLEHCEDPEKVIKNARKLGKIIRLFEWVDMRISDGHIHILTQKNLDLWLGGEGKVEEIHKSGANGKAYWGIFKGEKYHE